ncbi:MAG: RNA polymerase sigma factor [Planctomycetota bacterium]
MRPATEFSLLYARARNADPVAFEALVRVYRGALERYIERHLGSVSRTRISGDDVFQETMLTLFDRISSFPEDLRQAELGAYVLQIAKRRIVDLLRSSQRTTEDLTAAIEPRSSDSRTGTVTRKDEARKLHDLLGRLPDSYVAVIRCCIFEGKSSSEAAEKLGLSRTNVKQRLHRARVALKELWSSSS